MLGGFRCSKNSLIGLNVFYAVVGIFLISLGTHWSSSNRVSSLPIIGGVVACGVFLFIISLLGIYGAVKHHQVILFFYMVILFVLFLIQFSIACACLAVSDSAQEQLAKQGWASVDNETKAGVQIANECCAFDNPYFTVNSSNPMGHPDCSNIEACIPRGDPCINEGSCCSSSENCRCSTCLEKLQTTIGKAFKVTGGVSLFFSFTEFLGVWLTIRFRNQKDPMGGNSSAFL